MRGYRIDRLCFPLEVADEMSQLVNDYASESQSRTAH
jgi:hypothetical protein